MTPVKNYQVPLIESNMDLLKKITGKTVAKSALEKSVEWTLNRMPRMQAALEAAREYIAIKNMGHTGAEGEEILKQIDKALAPEKQEP
jgi:hypothetical protein